MATTVQPRRKKLLPSITVLACTAVLALAAEVAIERYQLECLETLRTADAPRDAYDATFGPLTWAPCGEAMCSTLFLTPDAEFHLTSQAERAPIVDIGTSVADPMPGPGSMSRAALKRYRWLFERLRSERTLSRCAVPETTPDTLDPTFKR
jgi:hypothetical protein